MLISDNIKNIFYKYKDITEIKYMDNTLWIKTKPPKMTIISLDNTTFFNNNHDIYYIKPEICNKNLYMYLCTKINNKSTYKLYNNDLYVFDSEQITFTSTKQINNKVIDYIKTEYKTGEMVSILGLKPIINTETTMTVVLVQYDELFNPEDNWDEILDVYAMLE